MVAWSPSLRKEEDKEELSSQEIYKIKECITLNKTEIINIIKTDTQNWFTNPTILTKIKNSISELEHLLNIYFSKYPQSKVIPKFRTDVEKLKNKYKIS